MNARSLSDQLRRELITHRLPRYYVHRVIREIDDHAQDIRAEGMTATSARLGDPRRLARHFAQEFRARNFAGRHPWLVFLVGPIPCTILLAALCFTLGMWGLDLIGSFQPGGSTSWLRQYLAIVVCEAGLILPLMAVTFGFGRWAFRSGCGARWFWLVVAMECAFGALLNTQLKLPTAPGNGSFSLGLGFPPAMQWELIALPALVAIGLAWHAAHEATRIRPAAG